VYTVGFDEGAQVGDLVTGEDVTGAEVDGALVTGDEVMGRADGLEVGVVTGDAVGACVTGAELGVPVVGAWLRGAEQLILRKVGMLFETG